MGLAAVTELEVRDGLVYRYAHLCGPFLVAVIYGGNVRVDDADSTDASAEKNPEATEGPRRAASCTLWPVLWPQETGLAARLLKRETTTAKKRPSAES